MKEKVNPSLRKALFLATTGIVFTLFFQGQPEDIPKNIDPAKAEGPGWNLAWSDEFAPPEGQEEGEIDTDKWGVYHGGPCRRDNVKLVRKDEGSDGYLSLQIRKKTAPNGNAWSWGMICTGPAIIGKQGAMGPIRKLFAPPEGGEARIELKFKGIDAKQEGMMISGIQHGFWMFSKSTAVPGTGIKNMRGEIDMLEHASPAGGKPMMNSIHITEFLGDRWGQGEKKKSSDWELVPTGKGQKGNFDDNQWHTLVAEWSAERVLISLDGKVLNERYNKPGENGLKGSNYHNHPFIARYFPFDEKFPLALMISSQIYRDGSVWGGIGPDPDEPTDYSRLPLEVRVDYVRFYKKNN